ncbi:group III truncated hemoglobin [Kordiimonas sp.]|uniref:group III truncated hemoglobin n=1 Tax=Kordiimonas sp. TaxID=1970157 RepID=UPI003A8CFB17
MTAITGNLDRNLIKSFVEAFYQGIRAHGVLGPIFEDKLADHWDDHIETLTDFWMTVLAGERAYKGNPFAVHRRLEGLEASHFPLWLEIFDETADRVLPPELAAYAREKAHRIADSLKQGLFFRPELALSPVSAG